MDKLKMQSENLVDENIKGIAKLFPNCVAEGKNEKGEIVKLVDFDLLKQELSKDIVDGNDERYTLNWAGKKQSILTANSPINATLRPCVEESVDFDNTKNLYIEGDNLDVLKLLRETYLNKVKMIYIDPPYNTGNDFVYEDDFATSADEYLEKSKSYDEQGNQMFQNNDSNGRFHSDWLSMMYSRLKIAKDLLAEDGIICISIDDNEECNLTKLCDEIFGKGNFIAKFIWKKTANPNATWNNVGIIHEYVLCYSKSLVKLNFLELEDKDVDKYSEHDEYLEERGPYKLVGLNKTGTISDKRPNLEYAINAPDGSLIYPQPRWRWSKDTFENGKKEGRVVFRKNQDKWTIYYKQYLDEDNYGNKIERGTLVPSILENVGRTTNGSLEISELLGKGIFDYPKPTSLIKYLLIVATDRSCIVMDFFSGSATTAQAIMQLNAEDKGNRKFILVQLPEKTDDKPDAFKLGLSNICEIGKERIRRAGKKIQEENRMTAPNLDVGFRDLKLDSSCMKDVYYSPNEIGQDLLSKFEDNIKEDRTAEDLLFQVMLDMGVILSSEIKTIDIKGKKVFNVNDGNLVCCFDKNLTDEVVTEIAKMHPLYAVFRDSSMATDSVAVNFDQIFETYSPETTRKVI